MPTNATGAPRSPAERMRKHRKDLSEEMVRIKVRVSDALVTRGYFRSVRDGFGQGGRWAWALPPQPKLTSKGRTTTTDVDAHERAQAPSAACGLVRIPVELQGRCIPKSWIEGVARLDYDRAPADVPLHRWRQFVNDCHVFLVAEENWAARAASLGWDAPSLFGCRPSRPLHYPSVAGLLWAIGGGNLLELHGDWAVFERAQDQSRQVHHRRRPDATNITLPWRSPSSARCDECRQLRCRY